MEIIDRAGEWRRLAEHYRQMTDEELLALARQMSALTEGAKDALKQEISNRRLKIPPEEQPRRPEPPPDVPEDDDPYVEDRKLVEVATVWSLRDAQKLQYVLDVAGIPFYMGPQKATRVDPGTMNFTNGVAVKIMRVGWYWALQARGTWPRQKSSLHQRRRSRHPCAGLVFGLRGGVPRIAQVELPKGCDCQGRYYSEL